MTIWYFLDNCNFDQMSNIDCSKNFLAQGIIYDLRMKNSRARLVLILTRLTGKSVIHAM